MMLTHGSFLGRSRKSRCEQRFLSCMASCFYEVVRVAGHEKREKSKKYHKLSHIIMYEKFQQGKLFFWTVPVPSV